MTDEERGFVQAAIDEITAECRKELPNGITEDQISPELFEDIRQRVWNRVLAKCRKTFPDCTEEQIEEMAEAIIVARYLPDD